MMDYKKAGVDVEQARVSLEKLKPFIEASHKKAKQGSVIDGIGGFAGIFRPDPGVGGYDIVAATDGVGTKIELCSRFSYLESLGHDLVAMCVNDLYCSGAHPAFFLDYISCGKLDDKWYTPIIKSISEACEQTGMALLGGETAEHPQVMKEDQFDLAGFCVGFLRRQDKLPKLDQIQENDLIMALPSNGLHSNGFSLIRMILEKIRDENEAQYQTLIEDREWIENHLLKSTRIYHEIPSILSKVEIKAIAHITGGGIYENVARVLPDNLKAIIEEKNAFPLPIYDWLRDFVSENELFQTFNMGYGLILIIDETNEKKLKQEAQEAVRIGRLGCI